MGNISWKYKPPVNWVPLNSQTGLNAFFQILQPALKEAAWRTRAFVRLAWHRHNQAPEWSPDSEWKCMLHEPVQQSRQLDQYQWVYAVAYQDPNLEISDWRAEEQMQCDQGQCLYPCKNTLDSLDWKQPLPNARNRIETKHLGQRGNAYVMTNDREDWGVGTQSYGELQLNTKPIQEK